MLMIAIVTSSSNKVKPRGPPTLGSAWHDVRRTWAPRSKLLCMDITLDGLGQAQRGNCLQCSERLLLSLSRDFSMSCALTGSSSRRYKKRFPNGPKIDRLSPNKCDIHCLHRGRAHLERGPTHRPLKKRARQVFTGLTVLLCLLPCRRYGQLVVKVFGSCAMTTPRAVAPTSTSWPVLWRNAAVSGPMIGSRIGIEPTLW
jgi:hypothetical protein